MLDAAGVVRGAFAQETAAAQHGAFALETLREVYAAPPTEAELEFEARSVVAEDGQRIPKRPSAVGRMRERQAKEKAEREAARAQGGGSSPSWWPF